MNGYDLSRALHIIAFTAWMAGLLMLPRFYAYQTGAERGGELERKMIAASGSLRRIILTPALVVTWLMGLYLYSHFLVTGWGDGFFQAISRTPSWFYLKFLLVLGLSGYHGYLTAEGKRLAAGERRRSERFWRMTNEVPFIIAIAVILLATLEPILWT